MSDLQGQSRKKQQHANPRAIEEANGDGGAPSFLMFFSFTRETIYKDKEQRNNTARVNLPHVFISILHFKSSKPIRIQHSPSPTPPRPPTYTRFKKYMYMRPFLRPLLLIRFRHFPSIRRRGELLLLPLLLVVSSSSFSSRASSLSTAAFLGRGWKGGVATGQGGGVRGGGSKKEGGRRGGRMGRRSDEEGVGGGGGKGRGGRSGGVGGEVH